jgi:hypothetical protein
MLLTRCSTWVLLVMILLTSNSCYGRIDDQTVASKKKVLDVGHWFIKEGVSGYYQGRDIAFIEEYAKEHEVHLPTNVIFEKHGVFAQIRLSSFWIRSIVTCYSRVESDFLFEYWVIKVDSTRSEPSREIYFLITKSKGKDKEREIIHRSEKFFSGFNISEETAIKFPMDDRSIYHLDPERFPDAFKGTELEGVKRD